jgi:hypothetical protein
MPNTNELSSLVKAVIILLDADRFLFERESWSYIPIEYILQGSFIELEL